VIVKNEVASAWRNGVTNTTAIVDKVIAKHRPALKRSKAFAEFEAELNVRLEAWFDETRRLDPESRDRAELFFMLFCQRNPL
jgi:hypothetical protein